ncbi:MAG: hypothetical protein Q4B32_08710 [Clostridia bacterium]|nr:hypothetical protein [Clostridia bacterium]
MKKKKVFFFVLFLVAGISLAQIAFAAEGIVYITGQENDARVKLRETPRGKIIGQYYAGAHYTADEEKDGWVTCNNRRTYRLDDENLSA